MNFIIVLNQIKCFIWSIMFRGRCGTDHMVLVVGFTNAISAYHHRIQKLWVRIPPRQGILDTTLCDKVCLWLVTCWWFSQGTSFLHQKKKDRHDITEILLKVAFNTITLTLSIMFLQGAVSINNYKYTGLTRLVYLRI